VISLALLSKEGFTERMAERAMRQHGTKKVFYTSQDKRRRNAAIVVTFSHQYSILRSTAFNSQR